ncbi:hypothetical protein FXO38_03533 [Capsicum annuum]|nr:hypothetical protein FXO38_03533 [Capsicum annuum]
MGEENLIVELLGVFLGYPNDKRGYKLFDLSSKKFFESRDVHFFEDVFPFAEDGSYVPSSIFPIPTGKDHLFIPFPSSDSTLPPDSSTLPPNSQDPSSSLVSSSSNLSTPTPSVLNLMLYNLTTS